MSNVLEVMKNVISEKTGVEASEVKPEAFFMDDLNIDEMELSEIVTEIEERLGLELKIDIKELKTVGDLLHVLHDVIE